MSPTDPPARPNQKRSERITSTGWRLVGEAANLVRESPLVQMDPALRPEDLLHASSFLVRPRSRKSGALDVVLATLNTAISRSHERTDSSSPAPVLARDGSVSQFSGRFHGVAWETFTHEDRWAGELTWIQPHPVVGGVPCTTRVAIVDGPGTLAVTVHVGARGGLAAVQGFVGAGQARPAFLAELNRVAILTFAGSPNEPRTLGEAGIDTFVRRVLLSEQRAYPVAVLAPVEPLDRLDPPEYLVPPEELTEELLGLAHLYVIDHHSTTYRLSDALGDRRLSAYWGALRVYMPEFSCADSGMRHPLLVRDRVEDPVERAGLLGELGRAARDRVPVPGVVDDLRAAARPRPAPAMKGGDPPVSAAIGGAAATQAVEASAAAEASSPPSPPATGENGAHRLVAAVEGLVVTLTDRLDDLGRSLASKLDTLIDEVARLRTATVVRGANAQGLERRLAQLERLLVDHLDSLHGPDEAGERGIDKAEESAEDAPDLSLVSVVQHAASEYADALLVLDSALASAMESPYEDVHRVGMHLRAMAEIARRRQEGRLGMSLRDAFAEAGVDYRGGIARSTSKRQRQQYVAALPDGRTVDCPEHIALGAGTYDPRYVLRIYFTSRAPAEPRFVIAHVGRHFDVVTTT